MFNALLQTVATLPVKVITAVNHVSTSKQNYLVPPISIFGKKK
jgi:hypothetical protein